MDIETTVKAAAWTVQASSYFLLNVRTIVLLVLEALGKSCRLIMSEHTAQRVITGLFFLSICSKYLGSLNAVLCMQGALVYVENSPNLLDILKNIASYSLL